MSARDQGTLSTAQVLPDFFLPSSSDPLVHNLFHFIFFFSVLGDHWGWSIGDLSSWKVFRTILVLFEFRHMNYGVYLHRRWQFQFISYFSNSSSHFERSNELRC